MNDAISRPGMQAQNHAAWRAGKHYDPLGRILVEKELLHKYLKNYDDNLKVIAEGFQSRMPWTKKRQRIAIGLELGKGIAATSVSIVVLTNPVLSSSLGAAFAVFAAEKLSDKAFDLLLAKVKNPHNKKLVEDKLKEQGYQLFEEVSETVLTNLADAAGGGALVTAYEKGKTAYETGKKASEFTKKDKLEQLAAILEVSSEAINIAVDHLGAKQVPGGLSPGIGFATTAISTSKNISNVVKESRGDLASLAAQVFPFTIEFYKQVQLVLNDYDRKWRPSFEMTPERQEELYREGGIGADPNIKMANAQMDMALDSIRASIEKSFNTSIDHTRAQLSKLRDGSRVKASAAYANGVKQSGQELGGIMLQILSEQTFAGPQVVTGPQVVKWHGSSPQESSPVVIHM